jgi:hypothetical protein
MKKKITTSIGTKILLFIGVISLMSNSGFCQAPVIVVPPQSQAVAQGCNVSLSVSVTGALPITYTWHQNFNFSTPYYQATLYSTNCTIVLTNLQPADAGFYSIGVQNADGYGAGKQAVVGIISSGIATNGFVLTVYGLTNSVWTVNYKTNFSSSTWMTLTNFSIPSYPPVFKFVDLQATNLSRFYQVIPKVY